MYSNTTSRGVYSFSNEYRTMHACLILACDAYFLSGVNLQHFLTSRHHVLISQPEVVVKGVSVDQCAARCLQEATFDCQSFDYCFDYGGCGMSSQHADRNLAVKPTVAYCDLYSREI